MSTSKVYYWIKILTKFISVQLFVQVLGFLSGILVLRNLGKQEYAFFILANSLQSVMNSLADSGVATGILSIGGKVWQDNYRFGQLINTAMQLRIYFSFAGVAIVSPILFWMLLSNGCEPTYAILLISAILIEVYFYLINNVLGLVLRLHSKIEQIQYIDLIFSVCRLALIGAAYFSILNSATALFASTLASGLQTFVLKRWTKDKFSSDAPISLENREEILKITKTLLPSIIYYSVQGQISMFLISIFGNTTNISEVGALGRLSVIFVLLSSLTNQILLPAFARCPSNLLLLRYLQIVGSSGAVCIALIGLVVLFPHQFLWVLGKGYANLSHELILMFISAAFSYIVGLLWLLNSTKAWIEKAWIYIPATLITQVLLLTRLDLSTVTGVIYFGMLSMIPSLLLNLWLSYTGFTKFSQAE